MHNSMIVEINNPFPVLPTEISRRFHRWRWQWHSIPLSVPKFFLRFHVEFELPANVVAAFGFCPEALGICAWLISMEGEIFERFGRHPVDLTVVQLREVFGVVVH